jgi:amino acid transporter
VTSSPSTRGAGGEPPGLRADAIGLGSDVALALASAAPAYSLTATLGILAVTVGAQAPAVLLVSFVPMLCIAVAYHQMNRVDANCGTSFSWVTRALGPRAGWLTGWAIVATGVLVMASLAEVAGRYAFLLFDWHTAASSKVAVTVLGCAFVILATAICRRGITVSASAALLLVVLELLALAALSAVAIVKA